jgi:hypothetical protein
MFKLVVEETVASWVIQWEAPRTAYISWASELHIKTTLHTALSKSNMKHLLTSSFVGLHPQRSRLDVKSENLVYV